MSSSSFPDPTRRALLGGALFGGAGLGLAQIALADLLQDGRWRPSISPSTPYAARLPHHRARAKRVLQIYCTGAVSHVDTWDYKPELLKRSGEPMPGAEGLITFQGENGNLQRSPWAFRPRGE